MWCVCAEHESERTKTSSIPGNRGINKFQFERRSSISGDSKFLHFEAVPQEADFETGCFCFRDARPGTDPFHTHTHTHPRAHSLSHAHTRSHTLTHPPLHTLTPHHTAPPHIKPVMAMASRKDLFEAVQRSDLDAITRTLLSGVGVNSKEVCMCVCVCV